MTKLIQTDCKYHAKGTFREDVCLHPKLNSLTCHGVCNYLKLKKELYGNNKL